MPFIRKVYGLVILQLLLTSFLCILSFTSEGYRNFQLTAYVIMILCVITCIAIEIVVFCYPQHAWKVPRNYILLGVYTICMGYIVSHLCSYCYWRYGDDGGCEIL
jgi:FtsH-binding integral membrane protein